MKSVVIGSLNLIGKATPGVSLFCLGLIMSSVTLKLSQDVLGNMVLTLMQPAMMAGAALLLAVSGIPTQQMILLCALPSATISGMFANEACSYRDEATTSILFSTILSLVTFSFAIYLIDRGWQHKAQHC
jgi:predicted permease